MARKPFTPAEQIAITAAVASIIAVWHRASEDDILAGKGWYAAAREFAATLWADHLDRAAGIIAALSPMTSWAQNMAQAGQVVAALQNGEPCPAVQTGSNRAKVWAIGHGADPVATLSGPKITRFYRAIMGDDSVVVVDRWAARVAGFDVDAVPPRLFALCEEAYTLAAAELGVAPAVLQATTWTVQRGSAV